MVHVVSYDLRTPGRNYEGLYRAIRNLGLWCHPLESFWFLDTLRSVQQVRDALNPHIDANDGLIVVRAMAHDWAAYGIPNDCVVWLNDPRRTW